MQKETIKIWVYLLCYNESAIIPFVMDYWKRFAEKVIVYDNYSTDNSVELLKKYDFVEVRYFKSDNTFNDIENINIKNNCWKEAKGNADYVFVGDMDEVLYQENITSIFSSLKNNGYTIIKPSWYDLLSYEFPQHGSGLLHDVVKKCEYNDNGKITILDPNNITEMNWTVGCHHCNPVGNIKASVIKNLYLFHCRHLSPDYVKDRYKMYVERFSDVNKENGFGIHYTWIDEYDKEFSQRFTNAKNILDVINNNSMKKSMFLNEEQIKDIEFCKKTFIQEINTIAIDSAKIKIKLEREYLISVIYLKTFSAYLQELKIENVEQAWKFMNDIKGITEKITYVQHYIYRLSQSTEVKNKNVS